MAESFRLGLIHRACVRVAQSRHVLATTGVYEYVRHLQYGAFIVIMFGFLMQWPALLMLPVLVMMCARLARMEERERRRISVTSTALICGG
jgi:protein-S-isoprenylcysteine O-methyltransferase Ste14